MSEEFNPQTRGPETQKHHAPRTVWGFYDKYCRFFDRDALGLDVGYGGKEFLPVLPNALGWDKDSEGFEANGKLPFPDNHFDYVFSSHCLEHVERFGIALQEWHRVTKIGGHIIITVPHQYLYERRRELPSRWNGDHRRYYTPAKLLDEIELVLIENTWRLVHCRDNDDGYDYNIPLDQHPTGGYEIECVIKKIQKPGWDLE